MIRRDALLSSCGRYRHFLTRTWGDPTGRIDVWIMLNPSTADANIDDPTLRRVMRFSRDDGAAGVVVVNLASWRATDPRELWAAQDRSEDIEGPRNIDDILSAVDVACASGGRVVLAWGADPRAALLADSVTGILRDRLAGAHQGVLACVGRTKGGQPRHPLYAPHGPLLPWDAPPPWEVAP